MTLQDKQKEILEKFDKNYVEYSDGGVYIAYTGKDEVDIPDFISHSLSEIAEATREAITPTEQQADDEAESNGYYSAIDEMNNRYQEFIK